MSDANYQQVKIKQINFKIALFLIKKSFIGMKANKKSFSKV